MTKIPVFFNYHTLQFSTASACKVQPRQHHLNRMKKNSLLINGTLREIDSAYSINDYVALWHLQGLLPASKGSVNSSPEYVVEWDEENKCNVLRETDLKSTQAQTQFEEAQDFAHYFESSESDSKSERDSNTDANSGTETPVRK